MNSWADTCCLCPSPSLQQYNASNNELVRTNTLVKGSIIQIDATPFRQWYETHVRPFLPFSTLDRLL